MYSNIRRGAIQIYIPLQKYILQETLVNIIGDTRNFFICVRNTIIIAEKKMAILQAARLLIELATLIASQVWQVSENLFQ